VRPVEALESSHSEKESTGAACVRMDQGTGLNGPEDDGNDVVAVRGPLSRRKAEAGVMTRFSRRALRGLAIVARGGQVSRVNDKLFYVKSQSGNGSYAVQWRLHRWNCECPDHLRTGRLCKHIYAVNFVMDLPRIVLENTFALNRLCKYCGSSKVVNKGKRYNKSGSVQLLGCKACGRRFKDEGGLELGVTDVLQAIIAVDLHYKGVSLRNISDHILQVYGVRRPTSTLHGWIVRLRDLLIGASEDCKPVVGDKWLADEMLVKVQGKERYLWNIMDYKTRQLIASKLTEGRGSEEALSVIKDAIKKAGKRPKELVTDGLKSYSSALISLGSPATKHTSNAGISKADNNNRIERVHNTIRALANARRGVRSSDDLNGMAAYYNLLRPHMSLHERAPYQAASGTMSVGTGWISLVRDIGRQKHQVEGTTVTHDL